MGKQRAGHTPGPWDFVIANNTERPCIKIVDREGEEVGVVFYGTGRDQAEAEANALTMTSAPDLLAALEGLRERLREHIKFNVRKHAHLMIADVAADKAIRKARGES